MRIGRRGDRQGIALDSKRSVVLGASRAGDAVLPIASGEVLWSLDRLRKPVLVPGASGEGKTETLLRIQHQLAMKTREESWLAGGSPWQPFYLDAKGDEQTAERYVGLMEALGIRVRVFPHEPFDGWRGDWKAIVDRLMQVVPYGTAEGAAYYRDAAKAILQAACTAGSGPPRSSVELLRRLTKVSLADVTSAGPPLELSEELIAQTRMRYVAFFRQIGGALDGTWSWEDAEAAYFLLDSIGGEEEASGAAAYLFADFGHYFKKRKPRERRCALAVDEFSAIARRSDVARLVEQARGFGALLLLAPQTVTGMGSAEQQSRILGSVDMVICHGMPEPERLSDQAGMRQELMVTREFRDRQRTGSGQIRSEFRPRLTRDAIRGLRIGEVYLLRKNKAMKVAMARAPEVFGDLPVAQDLEVDWGGQSLSEKAVDSYGKEEERISNEL